MPRTSLEIFRRQPLGVPLLMLVEDYESRIIAAYRTAGFDDVLRSHGAVLRYLGADGARISDIAARAGITKQTVGRIVRDLERLGYVTVMPGIVDRRVRLVRFSPRGEQLVGCSLKIIDDVRAAYSQLIGAGPFQYFCDDLNHIVLKLQIDLSFLQDSAYPAGTAPRIDNPAGRADGAEGATGFGRFRHFGRLLVELSDDFEGRLGAECAALGLQLPSRPTLALLYGLDAGGSSVSELAQPLPVTVQAVSFTVRQMVDDGWLMVSGNKEDNRAKTITLSEQGTLRVAQLNRAMSGVHRYYIDRLGKDRLERLESALLMLARRTAESPGLRLRGGRRVPESNIQQN